MEVTEAPASNPPGQRVISCQQLLPSGLPVVDYEVIEGGGRLLRDPDGRLDSLLAQVSSTD